MRGGRYSTKFLQLLMSGENKVSPGMAPFLKSVDETLLIVKGERSASDTTLVSRVRYFTVVRVGNNGQRESLEAFWRKQGFVVE